MFILLFPGTFQLFLFCHFLQILHGNRIVHQCLYDEVVRAEEYTEKVRPYLEKIRYHVDKLELLVDDEIWPLPKYRELLFSR